MRWAPAYSRALRRVRRVVQRSMFSGDSSPRHLAIAELICYRSGEQNGLLDLAFVGAKKFQRFTFLKSAFKCQDTWIQFNLSNVVCIEPMPFRVDTVNRVRKNITLSRF